ncbi:hypothetical protein OHS33_39275 (plasmid) [Streptomyces sp. NBC_00536]|uniref:hypothetical protein n=1 Tax=Streptomyces sp. NBC_00536 TaxID=2975769 RepID=UPI002E80A99F|nr:hypothetical protein [Streptomyces sp. NBC_00536]WUC84497.1 hypothetical protein OHS33_39275 [Streptomyces sp. NBC_00536]
MGGSAGLRSEGNAVTPAGGSVAGREGAQGAMVLAVGIAVAALRGMNQWMGDRRQRFEDLAPVRQAAVKAKAERIKAQAENAAALQKITDDATQARAKGRIQSPTDFGRSATKSGGKPGAGSSGAGGVASPKGKATPNGSAGTPPRKGLDPNKQGKTPGALSSGAGPGAGVRKGPSKGPGGKDPSLSGTGSSKGKDTKGTGKASDGVKSPKGAKSSNAAASPAVERARGRQERAAARQTARLEGRAKDRDAARDHKNGVREARQAARGKVRNDRIEARGARKAQERAAQAEARQAARKARKETRQKEKAAAPTRTTLAQAAAKEAQRRFAERRKNPGTPVISKDKKPKATAPGSPGTPGSTAPKVSLVKPPKPTSETGPTSPTAPTVNLRKPPKPPGPTSATGPTAGPKVNLKKAPKPTAGVPTSPKVNLRKPPKPPRPTAGPKVNLRKPPKPPAGEPGRSWLFWKKKPKAPNSGPQGRSGTSTPGNAAPGGSSRPGSRSRSTRQQQTSPPPTPDADGAWLKPPPGMTATYSDTTLIRLDQDKPKAKDPAAVTSSKRLGLPPGSSGSALGQGAAIVCKFPNPREGARPMGGAPADTQFKDSDLTVYDVIESDEDMADEILLGAAHANLVAERCEGLVGALEALRAELIEKSVPGVFVGWCTKLIERAGVVQDKAEAVAQGLPRAAEAIAHAGQVAAEHDKPAADLVRDMGHTAPADASYHKE